MVRAFTANILYRTILLCVFEFIGLSHRILCSNQWQYVHPGPLSCYNACLDNPDTYVCVCQNLSKVSHYQISRGYLHKDISCVRSSKPTRLIHTTRIHPQRYNFSQAVMWPFWKQVFSFRELIINISFITMGQNNSVEVTAALTCSKSKQRKDGLIGQWI